MGRADYLAEGDWNAICWECGRKHKASTMLKHWQGYYVCPRCWEPRHPQDFVRGVTENPAAAWAQEQIGISPMLLLTTESATGGAGAFPGAPVTIASLNVYDFVLDYLDLSAVPSWLTSVVIRVPENTTITSLVAGTSLGVTVTVNNYGKIVTTTDPSSLLTIRNL